MHRIDVPTATGDNLFTEGDPGGGIPATVVAADWLNDLQENVCHLIEESGEPLTKGDETNLLNAINSLIVGIKRVSEIASVSAISAVVPSYNGQQFLLKEYSAATGKGGGTLYYDSSDTTTPANNVTVFVTSGNHRIKRPDRPVMLADAGAVLDGTTDDTAAVNRALALGVAIGGENKVCAVSGNVVLPTVTSIYDVEFKQLDPANTSRRTLYMAAGSLCILKNVKVNRNGNGVGGSLSSAAGIYIASCTSGLLQEVEVYGNDYGNGIVLADCSNFTLVNPIVRDIRGGSSSGSTLTDDVVQGIWVTGGSSITIENPRVRNLSSQWTGQAQWSRFTRGIAVGGCKNFDIINAKISSVDQGIDITGDMNPSRFSIVGGQITDVYSFGVKCANSATFGKIMGVTVYRAGNCAFMASAPAGVLAKMTQNLLYIGCQAIETGYGGAWTGLAAIAGFRSSNSGAVADYPRSIKYVACDAIGDGAPMEYGFVNDSPISGTGDQWVETVNCNVLGASIARYSGMHSPYTSRSTSTFSVPNNAYTSVSWTITDDKQNIANSATQHTIRRDGDYTLSTTLNFDANATGVRGVRFTKNGTLITGSLVLLPSSGASNSTSIPCSLTVHLVVGDVIECQAFQNSGGALNIQNPGLCITAGRLN